MRAYSFLYVSTYEGTDGGGIYAAGFDPINGEVGSFIKVADLDRAALMVRHPHKNVLYVVGIDGKPEDGVGCIGAYQIDGKTGELHVLEKTKTGAGLPTFITASADGGFLLQASFSTAAASVLTIREDGSLAPSGEIHRFEGRSINPIRQTRSHPHCINIHPIDNSIFLTDLGADKISRFQLDRRCGELIPYGEEQYAMHLGAGPRIMRFSQDGRHLYMINELHNTVSSYRYQGADRPLEPLQVISTLPDSQSPSFETHMAGELRLHPNQQYVYATNRSAGRGQYDGVTVFQRNTLTGVLTPIQYEPTAKHPRHFNIDPTGNWLFVSARDADQLQCFRIDTDTGWLQQVGEPIVFQQPWDVQFYSVKE